MRKLLKCIWVLQEVDNRKRTPKLGRGFTTALRLNPYNPLSYIALVIMAIVGVVLFGFVGIWKEVTNPFKWN